MVGSKASMTLNLSDTDTETNLRSTSKYGSNAGATEVKKGGKLFGSIFTCDKDTSMDVIMEEERDSEAAMGDLRYDTLAADERRESSHDYDGETAAQQQSMAITTDMASNDPDMLDTVFDGVESQICKGTPSWIEASNELDVLYVTLDGLESRVCGNGETTTSEILQHEEHVVESRQAWTKGEICVSEETTSGILQDEERIVESRQAWTKGETTSEIHETKMPNKRSVELDTGRKSTTEVKDILDHVFENLEGFVCQEEAATKENHKKDGALVRGGVDHIHSLITDSTDSGEGTESVTERVSMRNGTVDVEHGVDRLELGYVTLSKDDYYYSRRCKPFQTQCLVALGWIIIFFISVGLAVFGVFFVLKMLT
jgi:hypothetical protein